MYQLSIKYQAAAILSVIFVYVVFVNSALAHVSVKPSEVGVGKYQTFNVSVPVEKDIPTTGLRLVIPRGLEHVSPNVKPGWDVKIVRAGESMKGPVLNTGAAAPDPETITEIIWTGGSIPQGMRDDFFFSAKSPAEPGELKWMAYQTYSNGATVAWDLESSAQPKTADGEDDYSVSGPFSVTKVIDDLAKSPKSEMESLEKDSYENNLPLWLSVLAVVVSGFALGMTLRRK